MLLYYILEPVVEAILEETKNEEIKKDVSEEELKREETEVLYPICE